MEVVKDFFVRSGSSARRYLRSRGIVPVPWHPNGFDFGCLGPFLDASGDEVWFGFAPDACGDFGFGDDLRVGIDRHRSPPVVHEDPWVFGGN